MKYQIWCVEHIIDGDRLHMEQFFKRDKATKSDAEQEIRRRLDVCNAIDNSHVLTEIPRVIRDFYIKEVP